MMYPFYMSLEKPAGNHTENTFSKRKSRNHNVRMNLDENKLANVQKDIIRKDWQILNLERKRKRLLLM